MLLKELNRNSNDAISSSSHSLEIAYKECTLM